MLDTLERTSRTSAILMALGAVVVASALGFATVRLKSVQNQVNALEMHEAELYAKAAQLQSTADELMKSTNKLRMQVSGLRQALSASRDAIAAFHAHDYGTAVSLYDAALRADPGNAYLMNLKAYSLFKLGQMSEAIAIQQQGINIDPAYAWGIFDLARFQCAAGDKVAAAKSLAEAVAKESRFRDLANQDGEFRRLCGILPESR
jgi:tetratricopeptide (TPR) repeat protein